MLHKRTRRAALGCLIIGTGFSVFLRAQTASPTPAPTAAESSGPPAKTLLYPLEDVHPGQQGVAYTVFTGVHPEAMSVEILGRLTNALGPKRDLILARLHGTKPEYTGVVAGMSGSPVYIDGKLVGALSYRIGQFSKEPIAGITPIEQMLEVGGEDTSPPQSVRAADMQPMEAPLVFSGFNQETIDRFSDRFKAVGLTPVSGLGGVDTGKRQPEPLEPGSVVSAVLVQGDLSVTGTCTVSYVASDRLLACGHPLTQAGEIDLPMAKAEVLATLASPLNSFKIVNATEIVGAFTQDRSSAIYGRIGAQARMIPVTVTLSSEGAKPTVKTMHFAVANHRDLTPQLMISAIYQCLQQSLSSSSESSYKLDGEIRLSTRPSPGHPEIPMPAVRLDGWQSQGSFNPGAVTAALTIGERFVPLFSNSLEQPLMTGVDLHVETSTRRRSASIEAARASVLEARAGQTIDVDSVLQPYQQAPEHVHTSVTLPDTLEPGPVRLLVSDGATLDRLLEPGTAHPLSLADTVGRLNAMHTNDRLYVTLLTHEAQAVLDAAPLTEVPLSMANVFEPLKSAQRLKLTGESVVELGSSPAEDALSGSQVLTLTVR